jgi:taurine transport system permease protein
VKRRSLIRNAGFNTLPFLSIAIFLSLWLWVASGENAVIPTPIDVFNRFILFLGTPVSKISIQSHIWVSICRVLIGMGSAAVFGIIFGMLLAMIPWFRSIFMPLFNMLRPIPPIAWIPLVTVWFGVGEFPKIFLVFYGCTVPVTINTFTGISMVPDEFEHVGRIFHARKWDRLRDVVLPSAIPAIIAGIKASLSSAWMILLSSEMISAKAGLGFLITRGSDSNDLALSMIAMILIGLIGCLMSLGLTFLERKLCPWKTELN